MQTHVEMVALRVKVTSSHVAQVTALVQVRQVSIHGKHVRVASSPKCLAGQLETGPHEPSASVYDPIPHRHLELKSSYGGVHVMQVTELSQESQLAGHFTQACVAVFA